MPFTIDTFDAATCKEIRSAIEITLTENDLPDTTINYSIYRGEAVARVNSSVASLTDEQITAAESDLTRAALFFTAALIAPTIRLVNKETLEGDELSWQNTDLSKLASSLEGRAAGIISRLLVSLDSNNPEGVTDIFSTAGAPAKRRGTLEFW